MVQKATLGIRHVGWKHPCGHAHHDLVIFGDKKSVQTSSVMSGIGRALCRHTTAWEAGVAKAMFSVRR